MKMFCIFFWVLVTQVNTCKNICKIYLDLYIILYQLVQFSSVTQSCPTLCNPWTEACQASLSITKSWGLLKVMSIESVLDMCIWSNTVLYMCIWSNRVLLCYILCVQIQVLLKAILLFKQIGTSLVVQWLRIHLAMQGHGFSPWSGN